MQLVAKRRLAHLRRQKHRRKTKLAAAAGGGAAGSAASLKARINAVYLTAARVYLAPAGELDVLHLARRGVDIDAFRDGRGGTRHDDAAGAVASKE